MEGVSIKLSAAGLAHIPFHSRPPSFEFIVGKCHYPCDSFRADFLSPKIARMHATDPSIFCYSIPIKRETDVFPKFLALGTGEGVTLSPQEQVDLALFAEALDNSELYLLLTRNLEQELTLENAAVLLECKQRLALETTKEASFLAANFHRLPDSLVLHSPRISIHTDTMHKSWNPAIKKFANRWEWRCMFPNWNSKTTPVTANGNGQSRSAAPVE
jgi:hypothetical protein